MLLAMLAGLLLVRPLSTLSFILSNAVPLV
jgi:hypothetical protein